MIQIGGAFTYEPLPDAENKFFDNHCPKEGELKFLMSGRCANYYVLKDISLTDTKKTAYVPIYTCETVLAPFIKAGYRLLYYGITKDMIPVFDESVLEQISVLSLCGYYGFCGYDRDFVIKCSDMGIVILEDTTHSIFSADGIDPCCDYIVGSMRKWIGVASGGFAIKQKGTFQLPMKSPDKKHLELREQTIQRIRDSFWDAEMMLREIFDCYRSDDNSIKIMTHYDYKALTHRRRENYQYLLEHMPFHPKLTAVFKTLPESAVPSHFTMYSTDREEVMEYLRKQGIKTTVYWPKGSMVDTTGFKDADYIYTHVCSIPCDQRYHTEDMEYICQQIRQMP